MAKPTLEEIMAVVSPEATRAGLDRTRAGLIDRLANLKAGYVVEADNASYDGEMRKRVLGALETEMRVVHGAIVRIDERMNASDEALKEADAALWKPGALNGRAAKRRIGKAEAKGSAAPE